MRPMVIPGIAAKRGQVGLANRRWLKSEQSTEESHETVSCEDLAFANLVFANLAFDCVDGGEHASRSIGRCGPGADAGVLRPSGVDLATLGPKSIIGQGPNGEKAASCPTTLAAVSDCRRQAKIKAGCHFKVGISMQTVNLDWSQLQVQGITDTLAKYGATVTGVASAEYQVDKQIADIENTIQQHPDGIISIPVDFTATAPTYKKIAKAGIKLVLMDSIPTGLKHPEEYATMVSADSQGNGQIAAQILASCVAQGGTIGLVNFGVDYFSTNERTKGVSEWMKKNRPDIKMKQVDFTDPPKVSQIAGDFLTANPDVKGVFAVWDQPALDTLTSMRAQGVNIPVTTVDLGLQSAIEIAKGGPLKATGSQRPYDQGVAEAMAMMNALAGASRRPPGSACNRCRWCSRTCWNPTRPCSRRIRRPNSPTPARAPSRRATDTIDVTM